MRSLSMTLGMILVATAVACSGSPATPTSPAAAAETAGADHEGGRESVFGMNGLIRGLDLRSGTFTLVTRTASVQVRIDDQTQVWDKGTQVRITALRNGQAIGLRGIDHVRYVLARSIGLL